jgi:hypothetical protein
MIKAAIVILFVIGSEFSLAQNRNLTWYLGWLPSESSLAPGIDFSSGIADTFQQNRLMSFFITNASICDTNGQVLFYTNGITVDNRNHEQLLGSFDFNPGYATDIYDDIGMGFSQGATVLTKPDFPSKYEIFYVTGEEITHLGNYDVQPLYLSMTEVDMNLDNGLGGVVYGKKNIHVVEDTVSQGRITACKHADGKSWWLLLHKYYSDVFYKILITGDTIIVSQQTIGAIYKSNDIDGMAVFAPDGMQYAQVNINDTLEVYDFDRCKGQLSDPKMLILPYEGYPEYSLSCAFSPNSRFLYVNTYTRIFQFDTWASDIQASVVKVAQWDTSLLPLPTYFFMQQLATDNKIYLSTYSSLWVLHTIEAPDSLGLACNVQQHSFQLPPNGATNTTLPNFPNYDLGALPGGDTCNGVYTAHSPPVKSTSTFGISPNPVNDWLNVVYNTSETALFELFDVSGKRVAATSLFYYFKNRLIEVRNLPAGIYLATVTQNGKRVWSEKVVVQH